MEELVEEILLRLPPAEPASLVRSALVCKEWRRVVSGPRFGRRFREFHRSPPMLGVICSSIRERDGPYGARFVPTCSFRPPHADHPGWYALDARHGRVLLSTEVGSHRSFAVWDPMADKRWQLPTGPMLLCSWNAAVLCAATGSCDHLDCLGGPFLVVTVATRSQQMTVWIYSSEAGTWSEKTYVVAGTFFLYLLPPALMGNTIYFIADSCLTVVMYDLATQKTSLINLPPMFSPILMTMENGGFGVANDIILMPMENGGLGVARVDRPDRLSLWSREANPNGDMEWTQIRVVDLEKPLPANACSIPHYFDGFAHGGVLFVGARDGLFSFDLKSGRVRKVSDEAFNYNGILHIVPYMSFYSPPALGAVSTVAATDQE